MKVSTVRCVYGPYDRRSFHVHREPWWTYPLERVVDLGCRITGHRWCNSRLVHWAICLGDDRGEHFVIPTDDATLDAYRRWIGDPLMDDDSDDDTESDA